MQPPSIEIPGAAGVRAPSFVVGRDRDGRWLAVETHGHGGGIFVSRDAAWHYAWSEAGRRPGAVAVAPEPLAFTGRSFDRAPDARLSIAAERA